MNKSCHYHLHNIICVVDEFGMGGISINYVILSREDGSLIKKDCNVIRQNKFRILKGKGGGSI